MIVVNVRGVETDFNDPWSYFTIEAKIDWFETIFTIIEAYFAFIIAGLAILTASYGFKWYLSPITLILFGIFNYYVTT